MATELLGTIKVATQKTPIQEFYFYSVEKEEFSGLVGRQPNKTIVFRLKHLLKLSLHNNQTFATKPKSTFEAVSCGIYSDIKKIIIGPKDLVLTKEFLELGAYEIFMNQILLFLKKNYEHYTLSSFKTSYEGAITEDLHRRLTNIFTKSGLKNEVKKNNPFVICVEEQDITLVRSYDPHGHCQFIYSVESIMNFAALSLSQLLLAQELIQEKTVLAKKLEIHISHSQAYKVMILILVLIVIFLGSILFFST